MRRRLRDQGLSIFFLGIFLAALAGQSVAGHRAHNAEQVAHGDTPISYLRYVSSSEFGQAVMENWQSEFLQFTVFVLATVWLIQRGSPESKRPGEEGLETDEQQRVGSYAGARAPAWAKLRGVRGAVYSNSMLIVMTTIFFGAWFAQSVTALTLFNDEQREHGQPTISWQRYLVEPDFWERTLQNWQSEFLAVGTMVVFTIFLRQRGSPESKPVGAPHDETASTG